MKYRLDSGVPSSLNYVNLTNAQNEKSPKLIPYPDWNTNFIKIDSKNTTNQTESVTSNSPAPPASPPLAAAAVTKSEDKLLENDATIVSTFQIRVDECNRLWIMDTGSTEIHAAKITRPALVIFNLITNEVIRRRALYDNHIRKNSFFANVVS